MVYTVYILYSPGFHKIYIGYSSDVHRRVYFHNHGLKKKSYTYKFRPWILIYTEEYNNKSQAMRREKQLKTSQGRKFAWEKVKEFLQSSGSSGS